GGPSENGGDRGGGEVRGARETRAALSAAKRSRISPEVHLRGMTVDEALLELEKYLDDALLAGLDMVRVVHGRGTGRLRRPAHAYLRTRARVGTVYRADAAAGGHGVTVAELDRKGHRAARRPVAAAL